MGEIKLFSKRDSKKAVDKNRNKMGFTQQEQKIMSSLADAWNEYIKLDQEHPDELRDFRFHFHALQDKLGMRVVRRSYPSGWPTYKQV